MENKMSIENKMNLNLKVNINIENENFNINKTEEKEKREIDEIILRSPKFWLPEKLYPKIKKSLNCNLIEKQINKIKKIQEKSFYKKKNNVYLNKINQEKIDSLKSAINYNISTAEYIFNKNKKIIENNSNNKFNFKTKIGFVPIITDEDE